MAIHQYIGARYVPAFKGAYSATTVYEALDVVDDGMGTTYIAKIPTPAGTPLNNTAYWALYGASSGAIVNLQNRMAVVENDLSQNVHPDIKALERSILVIGNSYVGHGCADKIMACFSHAYEKRSSGAGFLPYTGHPDCFEDAINSAISDSGIDNNTITDILFVSAMGDTRAYTEDYSTFNSRLNTAMAALQTKIANNFPNVKYVSVTLAEARNVTAFADNTYKALYAVHNFFRRNCANFDMAYLGWSGWNSMFTNDIDSDHYHPTPAGAQVIGEWIMRSYFGRAEYVIKHSSKSNTPFNYTSGSTAQVQIDITPDITTVAVGKATVASGAPIIAALSVLIDTNDLPFPVPAPNSDIDFYGQLSDIYGTPLEFLFETLRGDSNGVLQVVNRRASSQSSISSGTYYFGPLQKITYQNYIF